MISYVDLQFFWVGDSYIVKELAILDDDLKLSHYIFAPPYSYSALSKGAKKQVSWMRHNYGSPCWNSGYIPYEHAKHIIQSELVNSGAIYVKGLEKKKWLEKFNIFAINMEDMDCKLKIKKLYKGPKCRQHENIESVCALRNVFNFKEWLENNICKNVK